MTAIMAAQTTWPLCHSWGWAGWGWHLLAWGLAIALVVAVIVAATRRGPPSRPDRDARALLDERYARGELTAEEYQQRAEDLR